MNQTVQPIKATEPITIPVEGMTCASCVRRVETVAAKVPGVASSSVNFAAESLTVEPAEGFSAEALAAAIRKAGYDPKAEHLDLHLSRPVTADEKERLAAARYALPGVLDLHLEAGGQHLTVDSFGRDPRRRVLEVLKDQGLSLAEPKTGEHHHAAHPSAHGHHHEEDAAELKRDLILSAVLTLPLFVLEMTGHAYAPFHHWLLGTVGEQPLYIAYFLLASVVLIVPGRRFFAAGIPALLRGHPEMNSLVAVGVLAAFGYSLVTTFAPSLLPEEARFVYYEAATVIVTLILLGRTLEARARGRTGEAIRRLAGLQAKTARVERGGAFIEIAADDVVVGDVLMVRPGERIAVDGTVIDGRTLIDESMISGEPMPVEKAANAPVTGGTINGNGSIRFRAERVGSDTMLAQIMRLVSEAQGAKLPIQATVDRVTEWFVPAVMALSILTFLVWLAIGPQPALAHALVAAVAVLIIACPCAMGLATPTSIMVGTGRAADLGVLFRKGDALQALSQIDWVVLDKTGTVTKGAPQLTDLHVVDGFAEDVVLATVAAVEARSEHPIAAAIVKAAEARQLTLPQAEDVRAVTGQGIKAVVGSETIAVGADRFMASFGLSVEVFADIASRLAGEGKTPLYAAIGGRLAAIVAVSDPLKPTSVEAIRSLKALGLKLAMVTGDNARTARAIAAEVGIDEVVAEVLPAGKVKALEDLRGSNGRIAFVGDGINDAPALAAADIGIAMGTGTDVAIDSADVVLQTGDLAAVADAIAVSRATMRNIRQNLFWAFGYNVALIPVAAGALYPAFGILLSPMIGAGAMALSSVFVLSNALRLRRVGLKEKRA